ncbi:hypothetical protein QA089_004763 [Meyerozyma guilliermondii]
MSEPSKVFVRPLGFEVESEQVESHFGSIGPVTEVQLMRGYAFVTFENSEDTAKAVETMNGTEFDGQTLQVEFAKERKEDTRGQFRVKVTNLPDGTAWQDFKDFVRDKTESTPTFAKVFRDYESGEVIGALEFGSREELDKAVPLLDKAEFQDVVLVAEEDISPFVPPPRRGGFRGGRGGGFRGDFRGGRGRGGFRGDSRGGFRGGRGGYRDDFRGGFRGGRGGYRDDFRGGSRGGRGGFRGGRGGEYDSYPPRDGGDGGYPAQESYGREGRDDGYDSYTRDRSPTRY